MHARASAGLLLFGLAWLPLAGCNSDSKPEVVVYTALDEQFAVEIFKRFDYETGMQAVPKYDAESTKTVGLTELLIQEKSRPRADVFWNNEILHTLRLRDQGLLEAYQPPRAAEYPSQYRDATGNAWYGFAARGRVLLVNTELVPDDQRPTSIRDLADEKWRGKAGIAKPLFGTTATHAACLFAVWGDEKAEEFFRSLKANDVKILGGNKRVAEEVAAGVLAFGLTDTDDAIIEKAAGKPVAIVYPDREQDQLGTLFIPNTIAIIKGCPHPEAARRLVDFVVRPEAEQILSFTSSAQIPLHPKAQASDKIETFKTVKPMEVDFEAAAKKWDTAMKFLREQFAGGD